MHFIIGGMDCLVGCSYAERDGDGIGALPIGGVGVAD